MNAHIVDGSFGGCKADWVVVSLSPSDMGRLFLSA